MPDIDNKKLEYEIERNKAFIDLPNICRKLEKK